MSVALFLTASLIVGSAPPQVSRRPPGDAAQRGMTQAAIALRAGAQAYDFTGQARCQHAPQASIYDVRAEMWSVQHSESGRSMTLTVWKPASGGESMFNLGLSNGSSRSSVNTVKAGQQAKTSGSGTVTFTPEGKGGTFTINATTDAGGKISGTVKCEAFAPMMAEGGN